MSSDKKTARILGVLIMLAMASSLMSSTFLESMRTSGYLASVASNQNQVLIGVLLLLVLTISVVSIPIVMFPIFKRYNESLALGYVVARIFEGVSDFIMAICPLLLVLLSQGFVKSGSVLTSDFQTSGDLILSFYDWISVLENIPYCIGVMIFSYLLYRTKLVPRWIAIWGFIGGALLIIRVPLSMFFYDPISTTVLAIPVVLSEMVLVIWLLTKGFNTVEKLDP